MNTVFRLDPKLFGTALITLVMGLTLWATAVPAYAGHGHRGHSYGHRSGHRGHSYGHRSGYRGQSYGHRSGHRSHYYYGHRYGHHRYRYSQHGHYTHRNYSSPLHHYPQRHHTRRYHPYGYSTYLYSAQTHGSFDDSSHSARDRTGSNDAAPTHSNSTNAAPATPPAANPSDFGRTRKQATMYSRGWTLLAEKRYRDALSDFTNHVVSNPSKGTPKVGYALSSAAMGDLSRAAWAMRRALRTDFESLHYLILDKRLRPTLQGLIERYHALSRQTEHEREADFMLASLHYLMRDVKLAQKAIKLARREGDRTESTTNLELLIERELADQAQHDGQHTHDPTPTTGPPLERNVSRAAGD